MSNDFVSRYFRSQQRDEGHVYYVNDSNETVAATWDLQAPDPHEKSVVHQTKRSTQESLTCYSDRRSRVDPKNFVPGGKYRAICKLFMGFEGAPKIEYTGTGWLITRELLVTAGHSLFDHDRGLLKYIKVYIGYDGPKETAEGRYGCQLRFGKVASVPAEYMKAIRTEYDVGFVQLEKPFDDASFMKYENTPGTPTHLRLGVVGYPGDIDGGNHMYENWAETRIDIATNRYLTYELDTMGGGSGSPVIMFSDRDHRMLAIGVHVTGGYPNEGSPIGPPGSNFEDYIAAINMKRSRQPLIVGGRVAKIFSVKQFEAARNLEFVAIPSSNPSESREIAATTSSGRTKADHIFDGDDSFRHIESIKGWEGFHKNRPVASETRNPSRTGSKVLYTQIPEHLPENFFREYARDSSISPKRALESAIDRLSAEPDVQTTFFISLLDQIPADRKEHLTHIKSNVEFWQAWTSSLVETVLQQKVDEKLLSAAQDSASAGRRCSYRAMIFDTLVRRSTWFRKMYEEDQTRTFKCSTLELHTQLIMEVLKGLSVPSSSFPELDTVVKKIAEGMVQISKTNPAQTCQNWIMITRYRWEPFTQRIEPSVRIIGFKTGITLNEYMVAKNKY